MISNVLKTQMTSIAETTEPGITIANRTNAYVRLNSADVDTVEKANAWVAANNLKIVYILETPVTVQLDPQTLTTLLGTNNVWSDGGNVSVEYVADTKAYIAKVIAAALA